MLIITIGDDSFTLSDIEVKALTLKENNVFSTLRGLIQSRVKLDMNILVSENSKYNPNKLTQEEIDTIIEDL